MRKSSRFHGTEMLRMLCDEADIANEARLISACLPACMGGLRMQRLLTRAGMHVRGVFVLFFEEEPELSRGLTPGHTGPAQKRRTCTQRWSAMRRGFGGAAIGRG